MNFLFNTTAWENKVSILYKGRGGGRGIHLANFFLLFLCNYITIAAVMEIDNEKYGVLLKKKKKVAHILQLRYLLVFSPF